MNSLPQNAGKAWNDIHTVACGSLTQLHMGFMRPYHVGPYCVHAADRSTTNMHTHD